MYSTTPATAATTTTTNTAIKRRDNVLYAEANDEDVPAVESEANAHGNESTKSRLCDKIPARLVLYFLSWSGFLVSFMMRNDINFALVAMTVSQNQSTPISDNKTDPNELNQTIYTETTTDHSQTQQFEWSSTVKSMIYSSFYCCYVLSQVAGGVATQYFGTKSVFGWSQLATALSSLSLPMAANFHYSAVIVLRSIQGFASGLTWPAMYALVGYWIPLTERSRFMSSFQGFSIGIGLTYPLCGFIIENFGWPYVFYCTGSLGVAFCIMWWLLAYNTPQEHPRISKEELRYIEKSVNAEARKALGMKVPWKQIFTSKPAWAIGITTFGRIWIHYIFIVYGPSFMKFILGFEYQTNGFVSGMPFILSYVSSVFFCYIADKLLFYKILSLTNVRKIFTALSQVLPGLLVYLVGYTENITTLLIIWFIAIMLITASYAGAMANIVDIAPNLAGPVLSFCQTIHMSASFLLPLVGGHVVTKEESIDQWRVLFSMSSVIAVLTYIVYQVYGTADIQPWNDKPPSSNDKLEEESEILKSANEDIQIISKP